MTGTTDTDLDVESTKAPVDGAAILANARTIAPILREEAAENERQRRLTLRTVEAIRSAGAFRMPMPRRWGGPEVDILTQIKIVEELSNADGSAGWCAMIGSDGGFYSASLDEQVGRALFPDLDAVTAGWVQPMGRLDEVDGGYRLSGRWQFASGCTHSDVMTCGCMVFQNGEPSLTSQGTPEHRLALLPTERFEIHDTWHTVGLCGTGSNDYSIDDTFVPAEQTYRFGDVLRSGTLYAWPGMFGVNLMGVPLGVARAAIEAAERLLADKVLLPEGRPARDDPRTRTGLGRAQALVGSARSYVFDVVGDFWATLEAGDGPSRRQRAALAGCYGHTLRSCREAVQLLSDTVGSVSIFRSHPFERQLRDLGTMAQHILCQPKLLEIVGGMWLGTGDDHPLIAARVL